MIAGRVLHINSHLDILFLTCGEVRSIERRIKEKQRTWIVSKKIKENEFSKKIDVELYKPIGKPRF
jgi:hypothetical protein